MRQRTRWAAAGLALTIGLASSAVAGSGGNGGTGESRRITPTTITVGVHGPFTGAVPLPQASIEQGARIFWKWRRRTGRAIHGRHVEVVVRNDNYNPTMARQTCRRMIRNDRVAMIFGFFAGPNEMLTCAQVAERHRIPYLSLGTTRLAVQRWRRYFAVSTTWRKQAKLLADHLVSDLGVASQANGSVYYDNPSHRYVASAYARKMGRLGAPLDFERATFKGASQSDAQIIVQELKVRGIENVFVHVSPIFFMQLLDAARSQDYRPRWVGIANGIAGSRGVARVGCGNGGLGRNRFVSPMPAFADRARFDPDYGRAMRNVYKTQGDEVTWLGWAASKAAARLLKRPGRQLTRRNFIASTENARVVRTGILPKISFAPRHHFGGRGVHVLRVECRDRDWHTIRSFVTSF